MKARINPSARVTKDQKKAIYSLVAIELEKQRQATLRRAFKLWCISLNKKFGFGKKRIERLLAEVTVLTEDWEHDEVFWNHVDTVLGKIGIEFDKENYEEMERRN